MTAPTNLPATTSPSETRWNKSGLEGPCQSSPCNGLGQWYNQRGVVVYVHDGKHLPSAGVAHLNDIMGERLPGGPTRERPGFGARS